MPLEMLTNKSVQNLLNSVIPAAVGGDPERLNTLDPRLREDDKHPVDEFVSAPPLPQGERAGVRGTNQPLTAGVSNFAALDEDEPSLILGAAMVAGFLGNPFKAAGRAAYNVWGAYSLFVTKINYNAQMYREATDLSRRAYEAFEMAGNRYKELESRVKNVQAYVATLGGNDKLSLDEAIAKLKVLDESISVLKPKDFADNEPMNLRMESTQLLTQLLEKAGRSNEAARYQRYHEAAERNHWAVEEETNARRQWNAVLGMSHPRPGIEQILVLARDANAIFTNHDLTWDAIRTAELVGDIYRLSMQFEDARRSYDSAAYNAMTLGNSPTGNKLQARYTKLVADMTKDSREKTALYMRVFELDPEYRDPDVTNVDNVTGQGYVILERTATASSVPHLSAYPDTFIQTVEALERFVAAGDLLGQSRAYLKLAEMEKEDYPRRLSLLKAAVETVQLARSGVSPDTQPNRDLLGRIIEHERAVLKAFDHENHAISPANALLRDSVLSDIAALNRRDFLKKYEKAVAAESHAHEILEGKPFPGQLVGDQVSKFSEQIEKASKLYEELKLGKDQARVLLFRAEHYAESRTDPIVAYKFAGEALTVARDAGETEPQYRALRIMEKTSVTMKDYNKAIDALIGLVDSVPARAMRGVEYPLMETFALDRADLQMAYTRHRIYDRNYEKALEHAYKALKIYIDKGYIRGQVAALTQIGKIRGAAASTHPAVERAALAEGIERASNTAIARAEKWLKMDPQNPAAAQAVSMAYYAKGNALDISSQSREAMSAGKKARGISEALKMEAQAKKIWYDGTHSYYVSNMAIDKVITKPDEATIETGENRFKQAIQTFERLEMFDEALRIRQYMAEKLTSFGGTGNVISQYMEILRLNEDHGVKIDKAAISEKMADVFAGFAPRTRWADNGHGFNLADMNYRNALELVQKESVGYYRLMKKIQRNEVARLRAEMALDLKELVKTDGNCDVDIAGKIYNALWKLHREYEPAVTMITTGRAARRQIKEAEKMLAEAGRAEKLSTSLPLAFRAYALYLESGYESGIEKAQSLAMDRLPKTNLRELMGPFDETRATPPQPLISARAIERFGDYISDAMDKFRAGDYAYAFSAFAKLAGQVSEEPEFKNETPTAKALKWLKAAAHEAAGDMAVLLGKAGARTAQYDSANSIIKELGPEEERAAFLERIAEASNDGGRQIVEDFWREVGPDRLFRDPLDALRGGKAKQGMSDVIPPPDCAHLDAAGIARTTRETAKTRREILEAHRKNQRAIRKGREK